MVGIFLWYGLMFLLPTITTPGPALLGHIRSNLAQIRVLATQAEARGAPSEADDIRRVVARLTWTSVENSYEPVLLDDGSNWTLDVRALESVSYVRPWYARLIFLDFRTQSWPMFSMSSSGLTAEEIYKTQISE